MIKMLLQMWSLLRGNIQLVAELLRPLALASRGENPSPLLQLIQGIRAALMILLPHLLFDFLF
jgi:hypothetical protein